MNRKSIASFLAFVVMAVGLVAVYNTSFAGKNRVATLTGVRGTVTLQEAGRGEAKMVENKMVVNEGDVLKTGGSGSAVIIRFDDGSMVKLGPLALMTMGQMSGAGKQSDTQVDIGVGKAWARVKKVSADSSFKVKTPTAVAGVRGTYYSSEVDQDSTSRFDVFDGEVAVSSVQAPGKETLVKANQTTTVQQGKSPAQPSALPKERLEDGRKSFSDEEFTTATFDVQASVSPQVVVPGEKATITIQVYKNGAPYKKEVKLHIKLSGSALFAASGASEVDVVTSNEGSVALEITDKVEESVNADVRMKLSVPKSK